MGYLLDANIFIEAKNRYYSFDLAPRFWEWLVTANAQGTVLSAAKVKEELLAGDDDLADWVKRQGSSFFLPVDAATVESMRLLTEWAQQQAEEGRYTRAAAQEFAAGDIYVVGTAHAHGHTVVTHERPDPNRSRRRIKIPEACNVFGVPWMNTFEMLTREQVRLG
jgi:hypothetical protein